MAKRASKSSSRPAASKAAGKSKPKAAKPARKASAPAKAAPKTGPKSGPKGKSKAQSKVQPKAHSKAKPAIKAKASSKPAGKPAGKSVASKASKPASVNPKKPAAPAFDPGLASPAPAAPPLTEREAKLKRQQETSRAFAIEVARLCKDDKCTDVVLLDVRGLSSVTDYIIIGSGTSDRQMKSVLDHVAELGHKYGFTQSKTNSDERSTWLLIDFADVTVHLFEPTTRAHYDIEMLWGDAPRLEWERPDQIDRDRAGLAASRR